MIALIKIFNYPLFSKLFILLFFNLPNILKNYYYLFEYILKN